MAKHSEWAELRNRRMGESGAHDEYLVARMAVRLGMEIRRLREERGSSQAELAEVAGVDRSVVANCEAGGMVPSLPVLGRLARALDAELVVEVRPRVA